MLDSSIPEPDLQPMLEELSYLRKNIFKSLPNCRLSSQRDSAAFNKASVHLSAFKVITNFYYNNTVNHQLKIDLSGRNVSLKTASNLWKVSSGKV